MKQSLTLKLLAGGIAGFLAFFIGVTFRAELSETWSAGLRGDYSDAGWSRDKHLLPSERTDQIRDLVLGDQKSAIPAAQVIFQRLNQQQGDLITVAFDLQSISLSATYPSFKVVMVDESNQVLRIFVLNNTEYTHGASLSLERIVVTVRALAGEVRLTLLPFYPAS
jgi:hypothetical protein